VDLRVLLMAKIDWRLPRKVRVRRAFRLARDIDVSLPRLPLRAPPLIGRPKLKRAA